MSQNILGTDTTRIEEAPDGEGIEIPIPDDVVEILDLEEGEDVDVTVTMDSDGTLTISGYLTDAEPTEEQKQQLKDALTNPMADPDD